MAPRRLQLRPRLRHEVAPRTLRGGSNTFYLYRIQDSRGTRPLLMDHKLSREALDRRPEVRDLLGEYRGECEALAAWRKALREQRAAEQAADGEAASP